MRFRPCIDIHNGKVKQIVGGSLTDAGDLAVENYVSDKGGDWYADFYRQDGLEGGHIILLNPMTSPYYEATKAQAFRALEAWPKGLQIGGGITADNAEQFLDAGASHVIVTSYVFKDGQISFDNLNRLKHVAGKEHLVLDLSCRKRNGVYYIVTDRWQKFTDVAVTGELLNELKEYCDEFLVHAVDVEGKASGIEEQVVSLLGEMNRFQATYAGGVSSLDDLEKLRRLGGNRVDVTIGSALDLFGGNLSYRDVLEYIKFNNQL